MVLYKCQTCHTIFDRKALYRQHLLNNVSCQETQPESGLLRIDTDKFYTKANIVESCLIKIKEKLSINYQEDLIIEPSAGSGAFISGIKSLCQNHKFYDLYPDHSEVIEQDYLTLNYHPFQYNKIHLIGNPPFGRQASFAIKFIRRSTLFCDSISFILPKSFKKDSMQNKIPSNFHRIYEIDLPENSFIMNDEDHSVPCVFQIWEKQLEERETIIKEKPYKFKFVKKEEEHDISFRRVGIKAGNIDRQTIDKSIQSHYFIKFMEDIFNEDIYQKLKKIHFISSEYTVGPKSISKPELTKEFNMILNGNSSLGITNQ